ncbi:MAG: prepilin-type N-terminal cleavage/methylation domain-containing protein [Elusimicrobia bacterium]|nr:prepilin-type N-terminal cleavage/methylation domain-containing protein [Elusimicrobiota bacterium]
MKNSSRQGFTLIEIVIAVAIMLLFIAMGGRFFENTIKSWQTNYAMLEIQQNARIAMDEMTRAALGASAVTVVIDLAAVPASSKITFQVTKDAGINTHIYYLSNGQLMRQLNGVATVVIPNVTELFFAKWNSTTIPPSEDLRSVYIKLVVEKNGQKITLGSYTHLRNE